MKLQMKHRLKALRVSKGLGVRELARKLKLSPMSILNGEKGRGMTVHNLIKFAEFHQVSTDLLLFGEKGKK